jgi:hypothetical protein
MIEGALEADGRIAAKNAVKIRAALHQVTDFKRVFDNYQETQPQPTDNVAQDRTRARSWVLLNVYLNDEPIKASVMRAWAEAYVLGQAAAGEWIAKTEAANKAADDGYIDWANWRPGDQATALLLRPTGGFTKYLNMVNADSYFKKFNKETVENLGTALSDSIAAGLDAEHAAVMIGRHVASPSRALTIAITEQNRAMSFGSIQRYKEAELEKMEWHVSDPCDKCAKNAGVEVVIGQAFPTGNTQPPAHPHCRCVLLPVIPGMNEEPAMPGVVTAPMPTGAAHTGSVPEASPVMQVPKPVGSNQHVSGQWKKMDRQAVKNREMQKIQDKYGKYGQSTVDYMLKKDRATKSLIDKGIVYQNGQLEAQFYLGGASLPAKRIEEILDHLDGLQTTNPNGEKLTFIIGPTKKNAYGWATLGGDQIWLAPKTAKMADANVAEAGTWKMPILGEIAQFKYTITHEWGHHIDKGGSRSAQSADTSTAIQRIKAQFPQAFKSEYGQTKPEEFFAENFAEFYLTKGKTTNEITQAMAKEFGWVAP